MERPNLDGMLLATTDPDRLHDWYADVLSPQDDIDMDGYRVLRLGTFHLLIDRRDDVAPKAGDPTRMILNVDVDDARAVAARVDARGTGWLAPLEDRDGSLFGTAVDPDGNHVQIIQLSDEHRAAMARES
ncbi:VOC family protein [Nocardiopsis dassonvillei]|jgi:predicted enzyme related to lactoylglutathione lyase|uniref:VOC family protein n=1 Tax=Nocardiopsis TaxID=2013 RepID=UPI00102C943C|nr:VOC family protein [Nocardiopsis dassonvillei]MCP3017129.1 VOC family protein [Nocardiopsis dassonvillei]